MLRSLEGDDSVQRRKANELILCAMFTALIAIGAFLKIPVGPEIFTLQFLFTLLAGLLLGGQLGAMAVLVYVILGLVGVPVFANGGGFAYVLQPTFGYLVGFAFQAVLTGVCSRQLQEITVGKLIGLNVIGMAVVYLIGLSYFYIISNYVIDMPIALWTLVLYGGILQAPGDFLLCCLAAVLAIRCYRAGIWINDKK